MATSRGAQHGIKNQCFDAAVRLAMGSGAADHWEQRSPPALLAHPQILTLVSAIRPVGTPSNSHIQHTNKPTHLTPFPCLIANAAIKGGASERSQPVQPGSLCPPLGRQRSLFHRGPAVSLPREGPARGRAGACHGRQASRHQEVLLLCCRRCLGVAGKELERRWRACVSLLSKRG